MHLSTVCGALNPNKKSPTQGKEVIKPKEPRVIQCYHLIKKEVRKEEKNPIISYTQHRAPSIPIFTKKKEQEERKKKTPSEGKKQNKKNQELVK